VILVDTTVWIDFLAGREPVMALRKLLAEDEVACHPAVRGEIALGSIANRREVLRLLARLPQAPAVADAEVLQLVEARKLHATGIGWVDAHLLASTIAGGLGLWTRDRSLHRVATRLRVAATSPAVEHR
jgi:predicted nucleic acid-binding protein